MEGVVTSSYTYPMLHLVPQLATYLVLSFLCAAIQPRLRALWHYVLAASVIYSVMAIAIQPAVGALSQSALNHFAYLQHAEVFLPPYGVHVLIPAYLTFLEPAIACIVVAGLSWGHLRTGSIPAVGKFIVLMLLVRPGIFPPLINAFYHPQHRLEALLSTGQFSLETIALSVVAYLTWQFARPEITD